MSAVAAMALILILDAVADGGRGRFYRLETTLDLHVKINIGEPEQKRLAKFDTQIHQTIIMDAESEKLRQSAYCPRYCSDGLSKIARAYCSPLCDRNYHRYTFVQYYYNSSKSKTATTSSSTAFGMLRGYRPFFGHQATETIGFDSVQTAKAYRMHEFGYAKFKIKSTLRREAAPIVRGLLVDRRYLQGYMLHAVIGLSDNPTDAEPSLLRRLNATRRIGKAAISFQNSRRPFISSFAQMSDSVLIGGLDKHVCNDWKYFPAHDRHGWTFDMGRVKFVGKWYSGPNIAKITLDSDFIGIPHQIAEQLIADQVLIPMGSDWNFRVNMTKRDDLQLEFTVMGKTVKFNPKILLNPAMRRFTRLFDSGDRRYTSEAGWSFGFGLLEFHCIGYDYDLGRWRWGSVGTFE